MLARNAGGEDDGGGGGGGSGGAWKRDVGVKSDALVCAAALAVKTDQAEAGGGDRE